MRLKVIARFNKNGYTRVVSVDGELDKLISVSRTMTGTVNEQSEGVFTNATHVWFTAFEQTKTFVFEPLPDNARAEVVLDAYMERARQVREWVSGLAGALAFNTEASMEVEVQK